VDAAATPVSGIDADVVPVEEDPGGRAVAVEAIEDLLGRGTELAAPVSATTAPERSIAPAQAAPATGFETKQISADAVQYTGKRISLNLVDADIKQLFRLFHDVSGLNFVLDPTVDGRVTVVLDNVPWDQALDLVLKNNGLDKVLENNVIRIAPTQKLAQEAAQRKALKEAKELEVEPITITRTLSYAKAEDVEEVIREGGILSPRGKVIVDERTNTLIISDIPKKVQPLDTLISTLDTETPQVMIEARIVETTRQFTLLRDRRLVQGHPDRSRVPVQRPRRLQPEPAGRRHRQQPGVQVRQHPGLVHPGRGPEHARDRRPRPRALVAEDRDAEQRGGRDRAGCPDPGGQHGRHRDQRRAWRSRRRSPPRARSSWT
jgi:hypothetical protein